MTSILVIQLKRLGDLILTTPALKGLRQLYPKASITLLIDQHSRELAPAIAQVDRVWIYQRRESFQLWVNLIRTGFDLCLDFTGNDRSAVLTFLSKAERRIGFAFVAKRAIRSWVYTELVSSAVREKHTVDHYIDLIRALGDPGTDLPVSLTLPESAEPSAKKLREQMGLRDRYCVIHPGTARPEKYWPADRWAKVISHLHRRYKLPCLITGGKDSGELRHVAEIKAYLPAELFFSVAGKIDFLMTAAMIQRASLFVGVDTAGAHLASAFSVPELVLFGPTNPFHWRPRHKTGAVARAGFDVPYDHFEPRQKGSAMTELSTEAVIRAMEAVLEVGSPRG
jgi:predicted lipopolysaccharide heptosyltransferase III